MHKSESRESLGECTALLNDKEYQALEQLLKREMRGDDPIKLTEGLDLSVDCEWSGK